jgi:hypothetical protein
MIEAFGSFEILQPMRPADLLLRMEFVSPRSSESLHTSFGVNKMHWRITDHEYG